MESKSAQGEQDEAAPFPKSFHTPALKGSSLTGALWHQPSATASRTVHNLIWRFGEKIAFRCILHFTFSYFMPPFWNSLFSFLVRSSSLVLILSTVSSRLKWIWQSQDTRLLWKWQNPNKLVVLTNPVGNVQRKLHLAIPEARLGLLLACRSQFESDTASYHIKQMMFPVTDFIQYPLAKFRQQGKKTHCPSSIYLAQKRLTPEPSIPFSPLVLKWSWFLLFSTAFS